MSMEENIHHTGIVLSVKDTVARVQIVQSSACAACKAKAMCVSTESKEQIIDALMLEPLQPGDQAEVIIRERLAWRAVLIGYILPFIVMMAVIAVLSLTTSLDEAVTGTIALSSIALYYLVLRLFRGRLEKQFSITARKA